MNFQELYRKIEAIDKGQSLDEFSLNPFKKNPAAPVAQAQVPGSAQPTQPTPQEKAAKAADAIGLSKTRSDIEKRNQMLKDLEEGGSDHEDEYSIQSAVLDVLNHIHDGALSGEEMIDYLADELGDYYDEVEQSGDEMLMRAYRLAREEGADAEGDPERMAQVMGQAIGMLSQGIAESMEECGMDSFGPPEPVKQSDNVNMNISMNSSGSGGIRDLLNILKDLQDGSTEPPMPDHDHDMLTPKKLDGMGAIIDDDFANEPDEVYGDMDVMMRRGDDLHSNQGDHRMRQAGLPMGNPAAIQPRLESLYQEIKLREGSGPKEKQHSKYVDRNSSDSKAKVKAAKDTMATDKKAEPGKSLMKKINSK